MEGESQKGIRGFREERCNAHYRPDCVGEVKDDVNAKENKKLEWNVVTE